MPQTISISTTQELRLAGLACAAFNQLALREGLPHVRREPFVAAVLSVLG